jgi:preprotein translocase subunit SecY
VEKLLTIFKVPELRRKILFTAALLAIYRIGFYVPLPIVNQAQLKSWEEQQKGTAGSLFGTVAMFGGTSIGMSTIFGLGIMPYISASIIFQLLGSVIPSLEAMMKEGESGRKRINEYTRYATVGLCAIQSAFWVQYMMSPNMNVVLPAYRGFWPGVVCVCIMTAGTIFLMWIGEQIDEYGIGNGISLLIMAGILARLPVALNGLWLNSTSKLSPEPGKYGILTILILIGLFVAVVVGVIAITESQRRIPTQSAKHVRGRRVFGGTRQYLPLKVNQAGVMPIIFASSLLIFPSFVFGQLDRAMTSLKSDNWTVGSFFAWIFSELSMAFQRQSYIYTVCYIILIYFFCYFWTAITFNPKDMAENLKDYGSFIPGYRPGRRTADYLENVMLRITYVGAAFLALVAVIPSMVQASLGVDWTIASFLGGTGLLIVISVCLDLVQKIDSHLVMRNYTGLVNRR